MSEFRFNFKDESEAGDLVQGATLADALLLGGDEASVMLPGSRLSIDIGGLRKLLEVRFGCTAAQFSALSHGRQDALVDRVRRMVERKFRIEQPHEWARMHGLQSGERERRELIVSRTKLHRQLRPWALGQLTLERPSGSSYHHLLEYDARVRIPGNPTMQEIHRLNGEPERVVVENDWCRAMAGKDLGGDVRMPWPHVCWEFRISGVRVLTFVRMDVESGKKPCMFTVYGRDDVWVADDYIYVLDEGGNLLHGVAHKVLDENDAPMDPVEFYRVANLVWAQVRAACILLDMQAAHREHVPVSPKLVRQRAAAGRAAPRDYEVVRLTRSKQPRVARSTLGALNAVHRAPQRGHLRRGTWVHFDDHESGELEYVNDGGFWVSKTWRRWHWAGDLDNMIEREYRL